ncbi:MAG: flavodoxin family protein [Clostridiales bacterium]|nr:flavodoxin family protein [Clostridiales bacterium]
MSKKILVISTSMRSGSNSDLLADEWIRGAVDHGAEVEKVTLKEKQIAFCKGCLACLKTQKCVIKDDAAAIAGKVKNADTIVWATPVYYYSCSGQMKTLIDRLNPLYSSDYRFRDVYLLATAAEDEEETVNGTVAAVQGWVDCFEKCELKGVLFAGGVSDANEIKAKKNYLTQAYELGRACAQG